ncbi:MAG: hypothetical protein II988_02445 [Clostridia bacterium]|nr:hypothetical protein [Clostridia bacterium]
MKKQVITDFDVFYDAVLTLKNKEECTAFFNDVCTIQELEALAQRMDVAIRLKNGESYIDVNKNTGASTATISRVSKCLNYGDGGYSIVIDRMVDKND